ncbi:MAG: M56 family metallopeptidase [Nitrososphaerota archaeon]|jgi:Zn-dependent protease with chaperone function|nr:M56 family metallopeptidase [Nitrososphaerota archaeon]
MFNTAKKPGANLLGIGIAASFLAFFVAGVFSTIAIRLVGLSLGLVIGITLFILVYILMTKNILRRKLKSGELEPIGNTVSGVPIFKVEDSIANAIAIGFCKHFQYIIISSTLLKLFNDNQSEYESIIEHESNHIRLMHNLTMVLTGIFFLVVYLSIISITVNTPIIRVLNYITMASMFFLFSRLLSRSLETMADKTSNPVALKNALLKIAKHNTLIVHSNKSKRFNLGIFSTHPHTDERPLKPNQLKEVSIVGLFVSIFIAIGLIAQIFLDTPFSNNLLLLGIVIMFSATLFGTAIVVIEYMFMSNLTSFFAKKFGVTSLYSNNALNGLIALIMLSAIPILAGITNIAIIGLFNVGAIGIAILITAIGTEPFKKGLLISSLSWILNSVIFILAYMTIIGILFNIL